MRGRLLPGTLILCLAAAAPFAQTDLDVFMARVLARRDDNWKKLQQYVLEERETLLVTGPGGAPIYGTRREYVWFPRDGVFIKSPLTADGVAIAEADRQKAEQAWVKRQAARERRGEAAGSGGRGGQPPQSSDTSNTGAAPGALSEARMREALEPGFVSAAYFLRFTFDPGQYALVGHETLEGRDVLRVEYYPKKLFSEGRTRPNRRVRERSADLQAKLNKVSLVTLWIEPTEHQILKYEFDNIGLDFLPGRSMVRIGGLHAAMEMGEPFPGVWLPRAIRAGFDMTLAVGDIDGRYTTEFHDYRLANVASRVR